MRQRWVELVGVVFLFPVCGLPLTVDVVCEDGDLFLGRWEAVEEVHDQ